MIKKIFIILGLFATTNLPAQNITLVDLNKLIIGIDVTEKDAYLSQRGFHLLKGSELSPNNYYWKSTSTTERLICMIIQKKVFDLEYYTEDPTCVTKLFNDIEQSNKWVRYYPSVQNKNVIVTFFKTKTNTTFITIKKNAAPDLGNDMGWKIIISHEETTELFN